MRHVTAWCIASLVLAPFAFAQQPAASPAPAQGAPAQAAPAQIAPARLLEKPPYILGPAAVQEYAEQPFFFLSTQASQKTLPDAMKELIPKLMEAEKKAGLSPGGPIVIVYHGVTPAPDAPFDVEVGFIVEPTIKAAGGAEIGKLKAATVASMLYTGKMETIGKAFESLFTSIAVSGKAPTQDIRQFVLYFEGEQSTNNISLIQVLIQ